MKRTVLEMLKVASSQFKNNIYVSDKTDNGWKGMSFQEVEEASSFLAAGLISEGVMPDSKIAIISEGRSSWIVSEYAILKCRAVSVPLSVKLQSDEIAFRIRHSEAKMLFVSQNCIQKAVDMAGQLNELGVRVIYMDEPGADYDVFRNTLNGCMLYADLMKNGRKNFPAVSSELNSRLESVAEDDVATISYTSGTTGNPKGIMLTHLNYWANSHDAVQFFRLDNNLSTLVILPLDHSFAHTIGFYCALLCSLTLYFVDARGGMRNQLKNIVPNIREVKPDFMLSVPAITGNFMHKIQDSVAEKGKFANWLFNAGLKNGILFHGDGFGRHGIFNWIFRYPIYKLADALVFKKVRQVFGPNFKFFVGGGAMLEIKQQQFFNCIGVPVMQGYGLSEASPIISVNQRHRHKFGSSGGVLNGIDCKILDPDGNELPVGEKGFVTIKGLNVMKGYFKNEKATAEVISSDGRLNTGDLGYIDSDNFLFVTGREKALLISADGEKYSPEEIEDAISNCSEFVHQCVLYNDHCKYTTAVVTIDSARLKNYAKANGITSGQKLLEVVTDSMYKFTRDFSYKSSFPKQWIPSVFHIAAEPFSEQNGMVNSTMKIMRFKVIANYKQTLDMMNTADGKIENTRINIQTLEKMVL